MLGINSFDELSYTEDIHVDENCDYHFTVNFTHNEAFPVGSEDTCVPAVTADFDGLPMLAGRWFWREYPEYIQKATGMNHLSLDYNPCGRKYGCISIACLGGALTLTWFTVSHCRVAVYV